MGWICALNVLFASLCALFTAACTSLSVAIFSAAGGAEAGGFVLFFSAVPAADVVGLLLKTSMILPTIGNAVSNADEMISPMFLPLVWAEVWDVSCAPVDFV